jgi:prepilin-type N-terminal cleavage/methylation domain-containing protein
MKNLKIKKVGFTLIELLIVIALLGALAVGLLASVDPFEQLKKGNDTSTRGAAEEFYNSVIRYYAQRSALPGGLVSGTVTGLDNMSSTISAIADAGELKKDFYNLAGSSKLARITVSVPNSEKLIVCFNPESKAFRNDQNTIYNSTGLLMPTGTAAGACPNGTSTGCFVCFQ